MPKQNSTSLKTGSNKKVVSNQMFNWRGFNVGTKTFKNSSIQFLTTKNYAQKKSNMNGLLKLMDF